MVPPLVARATVAALFAALVCLLSASPASAAFPGRDGLIGYTQEELQEIRGQPVRGLHRRTGRVRVLLRLPRRFDPFPLSSELSEFAFRPDGRVLALDVGHRTRDAFLAGADGIQLVSLRGKPRFRRLTRHFDPSGRFGRDGQADWSPNGRRIVFSRTYSEEGRPRGRCASAVGCIRVYERGRTRALGPGSKPSWSVRNLIAFERYTGENAIWVVRPNGSGLRRLVSGSTGTCPTWNCGAPDWSPDGRRLAFERRSGRFTGPLEIATIRSDGRDLRVLARGTDPAYAPSGRWIAFVDFNDPVRRLCVIRPSGRRKRCFRRPQGGDPFHIDWQPLPRR